MATKIETVSPREAQRVIAAARESYRHRVGPFKPDGVQWVASIDSPAVLGGVPHSRTYTGELAVPNPIERQRTPVQAVIMISGPRADGTTANTANMFIGDSNVTVAKGFPLLPGMTIAANWIDLADIYFVPLDAADVLRLWYVV